MESRLHFGFPFKLVVALAAVFAAVAVTRASAADFEKDVGPCPEPPGGGFVLRCPTAFVGEEYEVELESEEGSGCTSPGNPYVWYEVVNSALPPGLTMTRAGVISGVPTTAGLFRFWVWNHDLTAAQGGPEWCQREDRSEVEFSIHVDPGLEVENDSLEKATIGEAYSETLTAMQVVSLNPPTGRDAKATWVLQSGALPPGLMLSPDGALAGTPTSEGSYPFVVRAQSGATVDSKPYTLNVRQPVTVTPFAAAQRPVAEVGVRFGKTVKATGGTGSYTWALASGALPGGLALNASSGAISGTPRAAGSFGFAVAATDAEGRVATANIAMTIASKLVLKTLRLKTAKVGRAYEAELATAGGVKPLKWRLVSGKLPLGVRFAKSQGALVGTPRTTGTFTVVVEARDVLGAKARQRLALHVSA